MSSHLGSIPYKIVTISSSSKFYTQAKEIWRVLETNGISCHTPDFDHDESRVRICDSLKERLTLDFLRKIDRSSILYVVAVNGYVGTSVTLEIGYAYAKNKDIFSSENIAEPAVRTLVRTVLPVDALVSYIKTGQT